MLEKERDGLLKAVEEERVNRAKVMKELMQEKEEKEEHQRLLLEAEKRVEEMMRKEGFMRDEFSREVEKLKLNVFI